MCHPVGVPTEFESKLKQIISLIKQDHHSEVAAEGLHGPAGQDLLAAGAAHGATRAGGEAAAATAKLLRSGGDVQEGAPQQTALSAKYIQQNITPIYYPHLSHALLLTLEP